MPFKVASKSKKPSRESKESSGPPTVEPPTVREFTLLERNRLARRFLMVEIRWLMYNNNAKVGDFVNKILAAEARASPKKENPKDDPDNSLRDDHQQETDSESEEKMVFLRYCGVCNNFRYKEEMVKYRKCGHWYHAWCVDELERKGVEDPHFRFWLCPKCKPDPKLFPGYKFTYRSKAEIEADKYYEDIDSDEPDFSVPAP